MRQNWPIVPKTIDRGKHGADSHIWCCFRSPANPFKRRGASLSSSGVNARSARQSGGGRYAPDVPQPPEQSGPHNAQEGHFIRGASSPPAYGRAGGPPTFTPYVRTPSLNTHAAPAGPYYSLYSRVGVAAPPTSPSLQLLLSRRQLWQGEPASDSSETVVVKSLPLLSHQHPPHPQLLQQQQQYQPSVYPQQQRQQEFHVERGFGDDDLILNAAVSEESPPRLARLTIARLPQLPEPEPSPPPPLSTTTTPPPSTFSEDETAVHSTRIPAVVSFRGRQRVSSFSTPTTAATAASSPALTVVTTTSNSSPSTTTTVRNTNLATLRQRKITAASSIGPGSDRLSVVSPTTTTRGLGRDGPAALSERPSPASSTAAVPAATNAEVAVTGEIMTATGWTTDTVVSPTAETMSPSFAADGGETTVPNDGVETTRRGPETVQHPELG